MKEYLDLWMNLFMWNLESNKQAPFIEMNYLENVIFSTNIDVGSLYSIEQLTNSKFVLKDTIEEMEKEGTCFEAEHEVLDEEFTV
jgi:hypothetical protein